MNRYIIIRRLRGPLILLLVGVIALLNQADILSWGHAWPLFLILIGVMQLAERAALTGVDYPTYQPTAYPGNPYAAPQPGAPAPQQAETSIVPAHSDDPASRGGQL